MEEEARDVHTRELGLQDLDHGRLKVEADPLGPVGSTIWVQLLHHSIYKEGVDCTGLARQMGPTARQALKNERIKNEPIKNELIKLSSDAGQKESL